MNSIVFYISVFILIFFNKESGGTGLLCAVFLLSSYFYLYKRNITYAFLLCLLVCANPGLILNVKSFGLTFHFLRLADIFFYLTFLLLFSKELQQIRVDDRLRKLFIVLIAFMFYQILVSLIFKLEKSSPFAIFKSMEELKFWIFGILFILPAYKIIQINSSLFIKTVIILASVYAVVFLISMYTPFKIIEFKSELRYKGSGLVRIMIQNAEIFKLSVLIGIGVFFLKKLEHKWMYYLAALLTISIPVIGMYRLELTFTVATIFMFLMFLNTNYLSSFYKYLKLVFFIFLGVFAFFIIFPNFSGGLVETFIKTYDELTGNTAVGTTQTRTVIELPRHLILIDRNFFFGVGFRNEWWSNYTNKYDWGLSDIPITSTFAMYGLVGMLIYYSRFIFLFYALRSIHRFIKENRIDESDHLEVFLIFAISAYFVAMISFRLFYIGWELTLHRLQFEFGLFIGIYFGLINKFLVKYSEPS